MDENERFRHIIKNYRIAFNLTQEIVEELSKLKKLKYSRIESGKQNADIQDSKDIAKIYGLENYEILNPNQKIPLKSSLPKSTQLAIKKLEQFGVNPKPHLRKIDLGKYLDELITKGLLDQPISAKALLGAMPAVVQNEVMESRKITDLLNRRPRNEHIAKVGKNGKEYLFQLKTKISNK